ncbi:cysteine--tRNA ligase [Halosegnis rubeus]|jgi:cysteinyl-tRNA synthetase|uniref:Cysteine--tRNA ligase n=1 Tax=Halosegnis rubeus TaxID=2212850 RepID=A0A5N5UHE0_9EURY|nr:cysteine--tRNA ligase [Halosegnis rubeus]KAB7514854.1 cysteine--tRNA ligase [Halosegnis rubeus]KAB7518167.1 cysteine--tRNA ligase [Halosegnis rubeus]KAB7519260.1 cysteine--tRNA ligase [Halosegnis rubeus]
MTLRVLNTLSGELEPFEPADPDDVLLYYCGLTVSDFAHLGHARTWVHVDVVHRWLDHAGYDVRHVENITDVNEKIVARVGEGDLGDSERAVATTFTDQLLADMRALNLKRAEVYPRVTEHVTEIIDLVETLIEAGYAYETDGSVYFDVHSFEDYGKLSNQTLDAVEPQEDGDRSEKRNPADFALWKAGGVDTDAVTDHRHPDREYDVTTPDGETWDSPWGEGRPGWHIECSAMSMTHLDSSIDIHMGGRDLVFPHHENEIAQSEAATGEQFARYWLHADLFQMGDEKMSSSLGNFVPVKDAVPQFGVNPLRVFFLSASYNSTQTYSEAAIHEAEERWERLHSAYRRASEAADSAAAHTTVTDEDFHAAVDDADESFTAAMNEDFNTREALTALSSLASAVNTHLDGYDEYDYRGLRRAIETFETFGEDVFGLDFTGTSEGTATLADELVSLVLDVREDERSAGNYERADQLRDELGALGIEIQDTDDGTEYRL